MSQPNILHNFKSKNFDSRKHKIQFIVLHYTETKNLEKAIDLLTSQKRKVSCHFVVDTDGQIYNLVSESKRAWHAGESEYNGRTNVNDFSIGIELHGAISDTYTDNQYLELKKTIEYLKEIFPSIKDSNIIGHSDVAPGRKFDPGPHFIWDKIK